MNEQEILSKLKAHVARHQSFSPDEQRPVQPRSDVSSIDLSNLSRISAEVWATRETVGQLNPRNPGVLNELAQAFKKVVQRSLSWYTRSLQGFHLKVAQAIEEQGSAINSVERSLARLDVELRKALSELSEAIERSHGSRDEVIQESMRTAELAIQEQQSPYVDLFRGLSQVVDVGCGRGEFLELLKENGILAHGVDSDHSACEAARRKFLKVVEEDLFDHLQQLPDRSLGGAFSARVIEYLPAYLQTELISLLSKKIRPGGLVVIETINPESRVGFGRNSRLDPTHLQAVHPELLKSLLESNCFADVKICSVAAVESLPAPASNSGGFSDHREVRRQLQPSASATAPTSVQAYAAVARRT
jgi:2-polyprenyl-3-methyl-5-hydroxy-6-metoxy-1,4-benzoquinol methylase